MTDLGEKIDLLAERMAALERRLEAVIVSRQDKEWYTTHEVAALLSRAEFTVREWCRLGRIRAAKRRSGRGGHRAWVISAEELARYEREGLLGSC